MLSSVEPLISRIYLGNALAVLKTLKDESVDLLLTDPPYGINYVSKSKSLALRKIAGDKGKEAYELLDKVLAIAVKKLKPNRHVFVFTNFQAYEFMAPIVRKYFRQTGALIWVKNNGTRGDVKATFSRAHEDIIHAQKGRRFLFGRRDFDVFKFSRVATQQMKHPCLPAGELVFVDERWQPIEHVRVGMRTNYGTVVETSNHEAEAIVTITLEDGSTTRATGNHPFLVARDGNIYWIEARHITVHDEVLTLGWIHCNLKPVCVKREQDQSPQRDTLGSGTESTVVIGLNTTSSGKKQTEDQSQKATKSTIGTATSKTTELRISSLSTPLHTSGITLVQENYQMANGKSNAKTAESGRLSRQSSGTTAEAVQLEDSASHASQRKVWQSASFSLRRVGSVKITQRREEVYNLTIQGVPAFDTLIGVSHNTEKPIALLKYLIEKSTEPGEVVLDMFAGVGSTLLAAKETGRQYIGIELEPAFFKIAKERLEVASP